VVEDHQVDLAKTPGIGDQLDPNDLPRSTRFTGSCRVAA